jgi:hypothetical protein
LLDALPADLLAEEILPRVAARRHLAALRLTCRTFHPLAGSRTRRLAFRPANGAACDAASRELRFALFGSGAPRGLASSFPNVARLHLSPSSIHEATYVLPALAMNVASPLAGRRLRSLVVRDLLPEDAPPADDPAADPRRRRHANDGVLILPAPHRPRAASVFMLSIGVEGRLVRRERDHPRERQARAGEERERTRTRPLLTKSGLYSACTTAAPVSRLPSATAYARSIDMTR